MLRVVKADEESVYHVGTNLRKQDWDEVIGLTGKDPVQVLLQSRELSLQTYAGLSPDGEPIILFGIGFNEASEHIGVPWMVATNKLLQHSREFLVKCRYWFDYFQKDFIALTNVVDKRNTVSRRWLAHLGCVFGPEVILGPFNLTFIPFVRITNHV
jgi:hypothetical protein